jgi:mannitol-1-phosphate 5-dehydrogenase
MSGVIAGASEIEALHLAPMTPGSDRAFLVEAFNRILISRIRFPGEREVPPFQRGITTFIEKDDLLPFEEAKLFGHNAAHALAAYIGSLAGASRMADLPSIPAIEVFLRRAFILESGAALIHRYGGLDPLFTTKGFTAYADDLLSRMFNPWLADTTDRVGRDVERKLGWDDRLIGVLRLGLAEGIPTLRYALGTAAALAYLDPALLSSTADPADRLLALWGNARREPTQETAVLTQVRESLSHLRRWYADGQRDPLALVVTCDPDIMDVWS